jgi:hypothetical protein
MVNHPARSRQSADAAIRRLLRKHMLSRVVVTFTERGVSARAEPDRWNPVIEKRFRAEIERASGNLSVDQVTAIRARAMDGAVAVAMAETLDSVVADLANRLSKPEGEAPLSGALERRRNAGVKRAKRRGPGASRAARGTKSLAARRRFLAGIGALATSVLRVES